MKIKTIKNDNTPDVETVETVEKRYVFRPLDSRDLFLMFKIIGKIGINEFTACFDGQMMNKMLAKAKDSESDDAINMAGLGVMLDIVGVICANLPKCETEIYQMLSNTSNLSVEEVKTMGMVEFTEMVIDFIKKDEFKDFIKVASRLFN